MVNEDHEARTDEVARGTPRAVRILMMMTPLAFALAQGQTAPRRPGTRRGSLTSRRT